ncbi:MAG: hypothetical protein ACI82G_002799 [Bradymonadia bacterium]|jgi:hypothetical protein
MKAKMYADSVTRFGVPAVLICLMAAGAGCGSDSKQSIPAIFDVDTNTVAFSPQGLGTTDQQVIVVSNGQTDLKGDDLIIDSTTLAGIPSSDGLDWCGGNGCPVVQAQYCIVEGLPATGSVCGIDNFQALQRIELAPGAEVDVLLTYYAETPAQLQGQLRFQTNASRTNIEGGTPGLGVVQLVVPGLTGRLDVNPNPVNFGRVASDETGAERCVDALFRNIGTDGLTITNWSVLGGGGAFRVREESVFDAVAATSTGTVTLNPNAEIQVTLCFAPATDEPASANLLIELGEERQFVDLVGNGAEPCIEVNFEQGYDFGRVPVGEARPAVFEITNCASFTNGETLLVDSTELVAVEGRENEIAGYAVPTPPGDLVLEPGESASFLVTCTPQDFVPYSGLLRIGSNDALKPQLDIGLNCLGSDLAPPVSDVGCRLLNTDGPFSRELIVRPLDTVECSAAGSSDEDGNIISWSWSKESSPRGSASVFEPDRAEVTTLFVDLSGSYELGAEVTDDSGLLNVIACDSDSDRIPDLAGCTAAQQTNSALACTNPAGDFDDSGCRALRSDLVRVIARPDDDIQIELSWTTPGDADETDEGQFVGTDVDIHVLHPNGCYNDPIWDVHYRNTDAEWGIIGESDDNGKLDRDDTDGAGPETVSIDRPEEDTLYKIAVHYYADNGYGVSRASVVVFIFGTPVFEMRDVELRATDYWWEVATILWPEAIVAAVNDPPQVLSGLPPCTTE